MRGPARQGPALIKRDAERAAPGKSAQMGKDVQPPVQCGEMGLGAKRSDGFDMRPVCGIVDQTAQIDIMAFRQVFQELVIANLLALLGG